MAQHFLLAFGKIVFLWVCVYFNGNFSSLRRLKCRIPKESCLGSLLFSIFTNVLALVLNKGNYDYVWSRSSFSR